MKLKDYLLSKLVTLCFAGIIAILLLVFMLMIDVSTGLILALELSIIIAIILWIIISFLIDRNRILKLNSIISQLDDKYLIGELLPKPQNSLELQYFEMMKAISRSAIGNVNQYSQEKEDYCQYIENWIHEIKTPLTACSLILENDCDKYKLRRELKRAENITENILYYARLKSGEKDTIIRNFSVHDVIEIAIKNQMNLLISSGISIENTGDFNVNSDDKSIGFIIEQLLINSAKYCPKCHIKICAKEGTIVYEDNGIGIPSHEVKRITERGFTGTNGRKLGNSTGMGLYIVNELCKNLCITLSISSEVNQYTKFSFSFDSLTKL